MTKTMNKPYDIHTDFAKFPVVTLKFSPLILWLLNSLMKVQRYFTKRSYNLGVARHTLTSTDGEPFKIIVMTPHGLEKPGPALLYYHGGAFALSYASTHLESCERYANEVGCVVVFVEYRLAPKFPFPCGFNDSYAALEWVTQQADNLGIDITRVAVGGDSAGGALAAGVAQKARDEQLLNLCAQLLIYPVLDNSCSTPSATDFVDVPLWNATSNRRMWEMYLSGYDKSETPLYAAPGFGELQALPPSYVETAEFDPLKDEGLNYIRGLQAQSIEVTVNETQQTIHGYDGNTKSEIAKKSMLQRIAFLKTTFGFADSPTH